ncbi:hypothetical protein [Actinoallomurus sp. NPDC050550]|uniref:hypothetical protein n=1 Tax=Actinoallomurus sp. NPDC050550 TaxID=3154937 RepID=UPI0033E3FC53
MTDRTGRAAAWIGRPMGELTDEELTEFAEWLAGERPADDPMLIAVRRLRRERMSGGEPRRPGEQMPGGEPGRPEERVPGGGSGRFGERRTR